LKVYVVFVDCIVGKVHTGVSYVALFWLSVWYCCHSYETIFIKKHFQWITTGYQDINPHVKFITLQQ